MQNGAATRRHGVNPHHGRAHANPRHFSLKRALKLTIKMGNVCRGATHIKTDDTVETRHTARLHHADNATGRARQNRILALKHIRCRQPAGRLHEHELAARALRAKFARHLIDITAQDG